MVHSILLEMRGSHACMYWIALLSLSNNVHKSTSSIWAAADYNWITSQCDSENISGHKLHDVRIEFELIQYPPALSMSPHSWPRTKLHPLRPYHSHGSASLAPRCAVALPVIETNRTERKYIHLQNIHGLFQRLGRYSCITECKNLNPQYRLKGPWWKVKVDQSCLQVLHLFTKYDDHHTKLIVKS